jgi:predicted 2-oxoglutarate/Fe(II)-dependent dioxygenase YbiX/tetratricopeptide (TPR) repeat protein
MNLNGEIIKKALNDCHSLVMGGRYAEAKPRINLLSKIYNQDIQRLCAGLYFVGGDIDEAIAAHESADTLNSGNVDSLMILGKCYRIARNLKEAAHCYQTALALEPENPTARIELVEITYTFTPKKDNRANIDLHGIFQKKGFKEFFKYVANEYQNKGSIGGVPLEIVQGKIPLWTGEKVDRLLIILDQGNGDALQFLRYVKLARPLCNHLTVAAYPSLMSLIALNTDIDSVIDADIIHTAGVADAYAVAFTLPNILNAGYEAEPYIHLEGKKLTGFNVGVCWRGNNINPTDHFRSASYEVLQAFESFTDITFHSLQVGTESDLAPSWMVTHDLDSYEATARVIASLDLVITVDTSVAHLAGAMGKPVWIGLGNPSCWRWEDSDTFTQWYKTARLFRNNSCWQTTFNWMAAELENLRTREAISLRLFTAAECEEIKKLLDQHPRYAAQTSYGLKPDHFKAKQSRIRQDIPSYEWIFKRIFTALAEARDFMNVGDLILTETANYLTYTKGDKFEWHTDDGNKRRLTISIQLSNNYEGGDLLVILASNKTLRASRDVGMACIFKSELLHKVTPITKGKRVSLIQWLKGV